MGRKEHPTAKRLGYNRGWLANWYADKKLFPLFVQQDIVIRATLRDYLKKHAKNFIVSQVAIERNTRSIVVGIHTSRMNQLIGKGGEVVQEIEKKMQTAVDRVGNADKRVVKVNILEVRVPETDALLVAKSVAQQIELRKSPKRVIDRAIKDAIRMGAGGIKIRVSGRLNGAEIARSVKDSQGGIPTQTRRAAVHLGIATAHTKYGVIGIKAWVFQKKTHRNRPLDFDAGRK